MRTSHEQLYKEAAFIAYYFHWTQDDILSMPHQERRQWCQEISEIHRQQQGDGDNVFEAKRAGGW